MLEGAPEGRPTKNKFRPWREPGRIRKALSGFYYVEMEDGNLLTCRARGKFRKEGLTPLVGDWVEGDDNIINGGEAELLPNNKSKNQ